MFFHHSSSLVGIRGRALGAALLASLMLGACTLTSPGSQVPAGSSAQDADARVAADARAALQRLYGTVAGSRDMVQRAAGVLVFPRVLGGALIVGGQHGQGALFMSDQLVDYYSTTAASVGWQAGAQSKTVIYVFNSSDALNRFRRSSGWQVGVDAKVAIANVGANGMLNTETVNQPVVSFVMNNAGVEGGISLNGAKITRLRP